MASSTSTTFDVDVEEHPASSETDQELVRRASEDTVYGRKCALVNRCFQEEIGFGRYQIELFLLTGLGWMADNIWLQGVAVVLVQVQQEFKPSRVEFATLALYVGLILGASVWGTLADMIGRKVSYNVTLLIAGVFGIAAGGAPNFVTFAALVACVGFGVGGKRVVPVDGVLFLEHIPQSHQYLLTFLSAAWAAGQLVASVVAWGFISNFSCKPDAPQAECSKVNNMGWRYTFYLLSLTCLVFVFRFFVFDLQESSKYLLARGRDEEALEVLQHISRRNGRTISLTVAELKAVEEKAGRTKDVGRRSLKPSLSHLKPLFNGRRLAINTTMTILLWGLIGLAYPLFNAFLPLYLADRLSDSDSSTGTTYRNYTIISVLGIVGPGIACLFVDWTRSNANIDHNVKHADSEPTRKFALVGRKLVMALSTLLTGVFLFLFTTSKTDAAVLGFSCASALTANAMYAVLYAYTPEVFPAPHRGTGDAVCSAFNRIAGVLAPVIKIATTSREGGATGMAANLPVFISASLLVVAAVLMAFLPIETSGRAAL